MEIIIEGFGAVLILCAGIVSGIGFLIEGTRSIVRLIKEKKEK